MRSCFLHLLETVETLLARPVRRGSAAETESLRAAASACRAELDKLERRRLACARPPGRKRVIDRNAVLAAAEAGKTEAGVTLNMIAADLGLSRSSVFRILRDERERRL
jgi:predicted transcriptional regulator